MNALALLLTLLIPGAPQDATRVSAQLSQGAVRIGETVVLSITVETATGADIHIKLPALPRSLMVTGSQEFSQTQFSIPGGRKRVVTREVALQPASAGNFAIPAIDIEVGGVLHRTRPLTLRVSGHAVPNPGMNSAEAWLRVVMSPETVYVGQQATLTAEAAFSEEARVRLTRPPIFELPSPTGFWVQEIPGGVRSQLRTVAGRVVEVQTKKVAYFPLNAGKYAFKPARTIIDIRQGFLYAPETREMRSASPRLVVLPLPEQGKPAAFKGAVGQYRMESSVEPLTVAAGEPVQIKLQITGTGNIKAVAPPALPQLVGAEVFAPSEESTTTVSNESVTGTKSITYVVIPERAGVLAIPPITFAFFDPTARAYRSLATDSIRIRVLNAAGGAATAETAGALRGPRDERSKPGLSWVRSSWFALLQLLPLAIIAALLLARRPRPRVVNAVDYLARVRGTTTSSDEVVYRELGQILRDAMADSAALPEVVSGRAAALHARIEAARFAPIPPAAAERAAIVAEIETVIAMLFDHRTSHRGAHVVLMLIVASFDQAQVALPTDPDGWYNLGNTYYAANDKGRAIWAWANTLHMQPRAADALHNLRVAGGAEALRVRPPLALTDAEWFLLAAILWWISAAIIIVALARRQRPSSWLSLPLVLAIVCAVVGVVAQRPPRYGVIVANDAALHTEPTVRSQLLRRSAAGAIVTIEEARDEWLRVELIDERAAWIARDDVAEIQRN